MDYIKKNNNLIIRLDKDEEIITSIYKIVDTEKVKFAWINGIGACKDIEIGYYNANTKNYVKKVLNEEYEITSLTGNLTQKDSNPWLHLHINVSDNNLQVFGGHLFKAIITATCEIILNLSEESINRKYNKEIGLYLFNFNGK